MLRDTTSIQPSPAGRAVKAIVPASFRRQIAAVKDGVLIEDVAAHYGEFRPTRPGRLVGRCVSPEHEDQTPSMSIYADVRRFRCYGCGAHGDALDLVMLAEPETELWEAMLTLSTRHGIALPPRPRAWNARQERQAPYRDALEEIRTRHIQRRLFRFIFEPMLVVIEDADEKALEAEYVWAELMPLAVRMARDRGPR